VQSDGHICQQLVDYIDDKRFMFAGPREEISDHVRQSVDNVRKYAVNAQRLPSSRTSQAAIKEIARACRDYVSTTRDDPDQHLLEVALAALRKRIGTEIVALAEKYNLDCDLDLSAYRDDAVRVLERWFEVEPYPLAATRVPSANP
jgi:hypothetical protein